MAHPGIGAEGITARLWMDREGRQVNATLDSWVGGIVKLKKADGGVIEVPFEQLGIVDRAWLETRANPEKTPQSGNATTMPRDGAPWPGRIWIDPDFPVTGGGRQFQTPHFEILTDAEISQEYLRKVTRVFETTYLAVDAVPLGLSPRPPDGMAKFRAKFTNRSDFDRMVRPEAHSEAPGEEVQGIYVARMNEIWLPYGAFKTSSDRNGGTAEANILIHETTHQVLQDWMDLMPHWMFEGFAEYMGLIPYNDGGFAFSDAEKGLKGILKTRYRQSEPVVLTPREVFKKRQSQSWGNTMDAYLSSMLMVYFFIHLDGSDRGEPLARFLADLKKARVESEAIRTQYNEAVAQFRTENAAFNARVESYNLAVKRFNEQAVAGRNGGGGLGFSVAKGSDGKIVVGKAAPPVNPGSPPEVPQWVRDYQPEAPALRLEAGKADAEQRLIGDRDFETLADDFQRAYQAIGIRISFRSAPKH